MSYTERRTCLDADSHIMELPDFLIVNADARYRTRAHPPERVEEMVALGRDLISGPKGYLALGAFNGDERTQALDQLGFDRQLVFSTFAAPFCFNARDVAVRYAAAAAHNRGIAEDFTRVFRV